MLNIFNQVVDIIFLTRITEIGQILLNENIKLHLWFLILRDMNNLINYHDKLLI